MVTMILFLNYTHTTIQSIKLARSWCPLNQSWRPKFKKEIRLEKKRFSSNSTVYFDNNQKPYKGKKTAFEILKIVVQKTISTPTLPQEILKFNNLPIIRIIRVLGGLSIILIFTHKFDYIENINLRIFFLIVSFIIVSLFTVCQIYVNYHRVKHLYKLIKSGELDIRN
jgi:hypothetical protein